jgi:hypothetical protein
MADHHDMNADEGQDLGVKRRQARNNLLVEYMTRQQTAHPSLRRKRLEENHLRLVRVLRGPANTPVCCETRILPVWAVDNKYIAVSYAWGPPVADHAIVLDGRKHMLANNLWHFLQVWRSSHAMREFGRHWLWIDALCIDQTDVGERIHQVKAMSHIFAGAKKVLVWLGRAIKATGDETFAIFGATASDVDVRFRLRDDVRKEVCGRPYWSRLWVFQELKSARSIELMCGDATVEWHKFKQDLLVHDSDVDSVDSLDGVGEPDPVRNSTATSMVMLCGQRMPTSLWTLLQLTSHLHCYDPRDKVYALLSIAKTGTAGIDADYAMHLP